MNVRLQVPDDTEPKLREYAASVGMDVELFILATVVERLAEPKPLPVRRLRGGMAKGVRRLDVVASEGLTFC